MPITQSFLVPADGKWHTLPASGPILSITADSFAVEFDIRRDGQGQARVHHPAWIAQNRAVRIEYTIGESV